MPATVNNVDLAVAEVAEEAGPLLLPVGQAGRHLEEEAKAVKVVKVKNLAPLTLLPPDLLF